MKIDYKLFREKGFIVLRGFFGSKAKELQEKDNYGIPATV